MSRIPVAPNRARPRRRAALLPLLVLLAACSTPKAPTVEVDKGAVARYQAAGYAYRVDDPVTRRRFTSPMSLTPWNLTITAVATAPRPGGRPLIVYLPPLGDADDAPSQWVEQWARAGYVVLSIQPLEEDAQIWTTAEARSGDFERVARARFTDDLMADRIARLAHILSEVRRRSDRGEGALGGLDWAHVALAGADLGAYTVQSIAAMSADQLAAIQWPLTPVALLVISPYARQDRALAVQAHAPTLMISARDDLDAYGLVGDVSLRHLAFDRMGTGDDYYFEVATASHRWLGGVAESAPAAEGERRRMATGFGDVPPNQRARSASRGGGAEGVAPLGDDEDLPPEAAAKQAANRAEREAQLAKARSRQLTRTAISGVGIQDVSIAFLDSYVRQDPRAHDWLAGPASAWLQDGDRLKHR